MNGTTVYATWLQNIGDYYFTEFIKTSIWTVPTTTGGGIGGLNAWQTELYDSTRNALHIFFINLSGNLGHSIRYL